AESQSDESTFNTLDSEEFMGEFIDESESESEELSLDSISQISSESESSLEFEAAIAQDSTDEFISEIEGEAELEVLSFEETTTSDGEEFENLMEGFAEDNQLIVDESTIDSPISDLQFEDVDEDLDELSTLDAIDQKLDELTQVSDESLGELNELLDSVQQNELEEEQLNKIAQDT
ncbi:MAG: hypothetical protein AAGE84_30820, partial [Cyanobacteria bacterium P01_G01_bin.39]